ncbi:MAG: hypothetical protein ACRCTD_12985, partial [Beijerinckiaceae bacterium]
MPILTLIPAPLRRFFTDMPPVRDWWRFIAPALPAFGLTLLAFFGPDLVFQALGRPVAPFGSIDHWPLVVLLAALITMTAAKKFRRIVLAVLALNQLIWFSALLFYGTVLKPEQVELGLLEPAEARGGIFAH